MTTSKTTMTAEEKRILEDILNPPPPPGLPPPEPPMVMHLKDGMVRIDLERCDPTKCFGECASNCPVNIKDKLVSSLKRKGTRPCVLLHPKASIDPGLCQKCRICERKCPRKAITFS